MSLKLKGIKTIANKLKQTKRDKVREKKIAEDVHVVKNLDMEPCVRKPLELSGVTSRASAKASVLDTAYEGASPATHRKQRRHSSDTSVTSRFDSFDLTTPMSMAESTTSTSVFSKDNDSVKVFVRVRPPSAKELKEENQISLHKTSDSTLQLKTQEGFKTFTFDAVVGDDVDQNSLFQTYAAPIVERCLSGYNGCIFAYGQTGSGKTYTMLGDASIHDQKLNKSAGIIPRAFQYLFDLLRERQAELSGKIEIECRCSFLEIYNETITDLLDPTKTNLQVREDKTGTHAAGLTEQVVLSLEEAIALMNTGAANRKVAHTQMNAVSSRSHSILSCIVTTKRYNDHGVLSILKSRLNLVDLAGSERQRGTGASGTRLKEASSINKSLSTLGLVIMSLGDVKDSLGGNANAVMISNVSPSTKNINETLSTLRFARGAKRIKNKAVANHDCVGDVSSLKAEIAVLKQELATLKEKSFLKKLEPEPEMEEVVECEEAVVPTHEEPLFDDSRYFGLDKTLACALRREDNASRTVLALSEEILLLQSALEIKQSEIRQYKLIGKLKDDKIHRLENMVKKQNQAACEDDLELQRLKKEVEFFKEKASRVPDATQYAIENMQLKHELSTLKWSLECNNSKEHFDAQIADLREKLLQLNEEIKRYRSLDEQSSKQQQQNDVSDVVLAVTKTSRMQRFFGRSKKQDKDELITRYLGRLAKWAETVVNVIATPLAKFKLRMKRKTMD